MADGTNGKAKHSGTTYDLCKKTGELEGKAQWERMGTLFIRANGTGGVVYLRQSDGSEMEIAVFAKRPKAEKPAAPAVAA